LVLGFSRAKWWGAFIGLLVAWGSCGIARAQSSAELERGRNLFRQSLSMEVAGDWAGALSRLEAVARIKMTPQVRFHQARCKEHLGRLTEALGDYRLAEIRAARQDLEVRVPRLVIRLSRELINSSVDLDGITLGDSRLGKEIPVDPGDHELVVRTPDGQSFVKHLRVADTTIERVTVDPPAGFVPIHNQLGSTASNGTQTIYSDSGVRSAPPVWAWIAGGVGVAGVIGASVAWYVRERAIDDLNNGCDPNNICPMSLKSTQTRGEQASIVAPIALGVGLAGLGLAAYGFLVPEHRNPAGPGTASKWRVNAGCDAHSAGIDVSATF
jgi:hypothetical protein